MGTTNTGTGDFLITSKVVLPRMLSVMLVAPFVPMTTSEFSPFFSLFVTTSIINPLTHSPSIVTFGNCRFKFPTKLFMASADSVSAHRICFTLFPSSPYPEYNAIYTCNNCTFCLEILANAQAYSAATYAFSEKSVGTNMVFMQHINYGV